MTKRLLFVASLLTCIIAALSARGEPAVAWHESSYDHVLGTSLELKFAAASADDAARAEAAALAEIDRLSGILSGYDATSEFSRWEKTRQQPVPVSPELFEVLSLFDRWRDRTGGALDAAAEAAGRLWRTAAERQKVPSADELESVVSATRQTHWRLDREHRTATHLTDTPLRLNSFAKSFIIERACAAALRVGGISTAVVNIGGDIVIRGAEADRVAVADPTAAAENDEPIAHLRIRDRAIATSGDYRRGVTIDGHWFSHLVDPRTGQPVNHVRSATVVSRSATNAGALATALCVMAVDEGTALARAQPDTEYLLVLADGRQVASPGWSGLTMPDSRPANLHAALAAAPAKGMAPVASTSGVELLVSLEVASISGGRARRPFVAVWIEDKDHFPVRTLGLWFKGSRWLPDLRSWYHAEQMRNMAEEPRRPESIASATRGPGRYSLRWDGRDDAGKPLPPGHYTLMVEAAREHGTHQVVSGDLDTSAPAGPVALPANIELSSVSYELRPRANVR